MKFNTLLLKRTVREILESMDISSAIVRVEYGGEFWTHIYFELKLARAEEIVIVTPKELRTHQQFQLDDSHGDERQVYRFRNFTDRPSAVNSINGVAIYESLVPDANRSTDSSGRIFSYINNISFIEKSIATANSCLETSQNLGPKAYSLVNMFRYGEDGKQKSSPSQPNGSRGNI